jgi:hypothetical protein
MTTKPASRTAAKDRARPPARAAGRNAATTSGRSGSPITISLPSRLRSGSLPTAGSRRSRPTPSRATRPGSAPATTRPTASARSKAASTSATGASPSMAAATAAVSKRRGKARSADGTSASDGRAGRITRSNSRDWPGWMRPDRGGAEVLPVHAQGRIFCGCRPGYLRRGLP